jgi:hypothetical protein
MKTDIKKSIKKSVCQIIFVCSLIASLSGCGFTWKRISESRIYPHRPVFSVAPKTIYAPEKSIIDFSAIYVWHNQFTNRAGQAVESYEFQRVWPDGQMYGKGISHTFPTIKDVESFEHAILGFYELDGTNIVMETFFPELYVKTFGIVSKDELHVYKAINRYSGPIYVDEVSVVYKRHPIEGLTRKPDWTMTGMKSVDQARTSQENGKTSFE